MPYSRMDWSFWLEDKLCNTLERRGTEGDLLGDRVQHLFQLRCNVSSFDLSKVSSSGKSW